MTDPQWRRVSPLSVVFYLAQLARTAVRQVIQLAVPAAAVMASTGGFTAGRVYAFGAFLAALAGGVALARFATFRYCIGEQSIIIRSGVLSKNQLDIRFDRIQAINDSQNLIYRMFNLVDLQLDTPGTAESEAHLPAVSPAVATDLRDKVQAAGQRASAASRSVATAGHGTVIHSLGYLDMLKIGLSSRTVLVLFAVFPWLWETMGERLASNSTPQRLFATATTALANATGLGGAGSATVAIVAVILLLAAVSVAAAMLRFNGYTLMRNSGSFTSRAGLLTVRSHAVATHKIQCLTLRQSMALGWFSGVRVTAFPAASYQQEGGPFLIPFATRQQSIKLARELWGEDCKALSLSPNTGNYHCVDKRYKTYLFFRRGFLPALLLAGLLLLTGTYSAGQLMAGALLTGLWLLAVALGAHLKYRRFGVEVSGDSIAVRRGLIGWCIDSFPARKVQSLEINQTLLQRRRGLANLKIFLASRTIVIPYLSESRAHALADDILKTLAKDRRRWI